MGTEVRIFRLIVEEVVVVEGDGVEEVMGLIVKAVIALEDGDFDG